MIRHQRLLSPTWVLRLTNAQLIDAFSETYDEAGARWTALSAEDKAALETAGTIWIEPNIERRLDVLHDEMSRRERNGILTDDDWKVKA
jgi:hypothetical protein